MNYQISRIGNYLKVRNIDNQEDFYGAVEEVFIDRSNVGKETYKIFSVKDLQDGTLLEIGKLYKEDNSLYTASTFEEFYTNLKESVTVDAKDVGTSTPYKLISEASTNTFLIRDSFTRIPVISAIGLTSVVKYLKIYNTEVLPSVGFDTPVLTIPIPANTQGAGVVIPFSIPIVLPKGFGISITANASDSDATPVKAGDVIINLSYTNY